MSVSIDGRKSVTHFNDKNGQIVAIKKVHKDSYTMSYVNGEVFSGELTKSEAENVAGQMQSNYFTSI